MKELLRLDKSSRALPHWKLQGSGALRGVIEVAENGRDLLEDRFLDDAEHGRIVIVGREWSMRPVGFGGGGDMYPLKVVGLIPNLRGIITLGVNAPGSKFEGSTHMDIMLRNMTAPDNKPAPILAAVGTELYDEERTAYINEYLSPLQGQYVEMEVAGARMTLRSLE